MNSHGVPGSVLAALLGDRGTGDHDSPYEWSTALAYEGAASERKVEVALDGAEHFAFSGQCDRRRRLTTLMPMGFCEDPAWRRAEARAVIKHFVSAFLITELTHTPLVDVLDDTTLPRGVDTDQVIDTGEARVYVPSRQHATRWRPAASEAQAANSTHALPDEPRATDLGNGCCDEEDDRLQGSTLRSCQHRFAVSHV